MNKIKIDYSCSNVICNAFIKEGSLFTAKYEGNILIHNSSRITLPSSRIIGFIEREELFLTLELTKFDPGSNKMIKILKDDIVGYVYQYNIVDLKEISINLIFI